MTLEATVLGKDAVRSTPQGYEVDLHLAWYRSLPLSCVEDVAINIDGRAVPRDRLRVVRNGSELTLDELADKVDDWWFVQDPLTVRVPDPAPKRPGSEAEVSVHLATRIPYIIIGPDRALVQHTRVANKVVIQ
jgi:hypothetical protein